MDLAGALKRLDDAEIDALLSAVTAEARRRNRLPSSPIKRKIARPRVVDGPASGSLTKGQLNAVRAAFKAGVRPSAIARQFGISQSDVRNALAAEAREHKSRR
jgi:predicted DNA binding protein